MTTWKKYKWGDIASLEYGKSIRDFRTSSGKTPVYGTNGPIGFTTEVLCPFPSIIIGRKGAYRGVHYSPTPFFVIDTAFYLKPKASYINLKFCYYNLLLQDINGLDSGSAIPSTRREDFYGLEINLPDVPTQTRIASILSSLDDKIELNRRMNQTLEQMAKALFNHYFVDNIDKDNLPEGWRWGNYSDLVKIWSGKGLKKDEFIEMGTYPIYGANGVIGKTNRYLVDKKLLLTGRVGTLGTVQIVQDKIWISDNVLVSEPYFNYNFYFSKFILNSFDFIGLNRGSTQPLITQTDLKSQVVLIPSSKALTHFNKIVSSYYEIIFSNKKENLKLTQIKDTLLPKLMSGEIDVSDLNEEKLIENYATENILNA